MRVDVVVNVDALWGSEPRWYRLGDVSLGDRGIPQMVVFYAIAGVLLAWVASAMPVLGIGWWPAGVIIAGACAGAGFVRPNGLHVHVFAPAALAYLVAGRHRLGWQPCPDPVTRWRPGRLVLEGDGGAEHFQALRFDGPGLVVRYRPARRVQLSRTLADRLARRPAAQALIERTELPALAAGLELEVPAGARLMVKEAQL